MNSQLGFADLAGDGKNLEFLVSYGLASRVIDDFANFGYGGVDLAPLISMPIVTSDDITRVLYPS